MEAAAVGVPLVLAAATGQTDLARHLRCTALPRANATATPPLTTQLPARGGPLPAPGFEGCLALVSPRHTPAAAAAAAPEQPLNGSGSGNGDERGWFEADVGEMVSALDAIYTAGDRGAGAAAAARRHAAPRMHEGWSWRKAVLGLSRVIADGAMLSSQ